MSKDCLVTKLKGTVQNNNLPKLGELDVEFYAHGGSSYNENRWVRFYNGSACLVESDADIYGDSQQNLGRSINYNANSQIKFHPFQANQVVKLSEKYTMHGIEFYDTDAVINLDDFNYMPELQNLSVIGGNYDFIGTYDASKTVVAWTNLFVHGQTININSASFTGESLSVAGALTEADVLQFPTRLTTIYVAQNASQIQALVDNITRFTSLTTLNMVGTSLVHGNLNDLGKCATLNRIQFGSSPNIEMSVEGFVNQAREAGITSNATGVQLIAPGSSGVTWKGATAPASTITWTATTITYNGETITA